MSRRIAYVFALAAGAAFATPASADRECFEASCKTMPEVIELPDAPAEQPPELSKAPVERRGLAPVQPNAPTQPQMSVDALPRPALKPLPHAPAPRAVTRAAEAPAVDKPVPQDARSASNEPVEVMNRRYAAAEPPGYGVTHPSHPGAGVVVVVPGVQYGADGIGLTEGRQNSAWELCQTDRSADRRCTPYNYQPYGAYGYRPLGSYRPQRAVPAHVYVPDAKIIAID